MILLYAIEISLIIALMSSRTIINCINVCINHFAPIFQSKENLLENQPTSASSSSESNSKLSNLGVRKASLDTSLVVRNRAIGEVPVAFRESQII